MQCLQCGVAIALLHKLRNGTVFCSEQCRRTYQDESNQLAMSRLMQYRRPKHSSHHAKTSSAPAAVSLVSVGDLPLAKFLPEIALANIDTHPVATRLAWERRRRHEVLPALSAELPQSLLALQSAQMHERYSLPVTPQPVVTRCEPVLALEPSFELTPSDADECAVAETVSAAPAGRAAKATEKPKRTDAKQPAAKKAATRRERRRADNRRDTMKAAPEPVTRFAAEEIAVTVVVPTETPIPSAPALVPAPAPAPLRAGSPASGPSTLRAAIAGHWGRAPRWRRTAIVGVVLLALGAAGTGLRNAVKRSAPPSPAATVASEPFLNGKDWTEQRATDKVGAALNRRFSLYRPSQARKDYTMEFEAAVAERPLGWVVRAKDGANYYSFQLQHDASGPAKLVRFAVIGGKPDRPTQIALTNLPQAAAGWHGIRMEVTGATIKTLINGKAVDVWGDRRLSTGAAGFTMERDERAEIRSAHFSFPVESKTPAQGKTPQATLLPLSLPVPSPVLEESVPRPIEISQLWLAAASTDSTEELECARRNSIILAQWETAAESTAAGNVGVCQLRLSALAAYQASFAEAFSGSASPGDTN